MDLFSSTSTPLETGTPAPPPTVTTQATEQHAYREAPKYGDRKSEELLSIEAGYYDTAKKSNHSSYKIPQEIVDSIEAGEATTEMIAELGAKFPVYRYRTCLTIHGNWPDVARERIGQYKNIRQNENGSLEILWTALDLKRKERIDERLKAVGSPVSLRIDSRGTQYVWTKTVDVETWNETRDTMFGIVKACEKSGAYCKGYVHRMTYWGAVMLCLTVDVRAVPMGAEAALSFALMDTHGHCDVTAKLKEYQRKKQEEREKWEQRAAANKAEKERFDAQCDAMRAEKLQTIAHLPRPTAWTIGPIYVTVDVVSFTSGTSVGYRFVRLTEKGSFGRVKWEKAVAGTVRTDLKWKEQKLTHPKDLPAIAGYRVFTQ